jgi:hypothetical protein
MDQENYNHLRPLDLGPYIPGISNYSHFYFSVLKWYRFNVYFYEDFLQCLTLDALTILIYHNSKSSDWQD